MGDQLTIDDQGYEIDDLSNEVKELLSLHAKAQEMMQEARRQAVIHELAVANLANMIASRVKSEESERSNETDG